MTSPTPSLSHDQPRLLYLDTLRGLAALWVVLMHMIFLAQPNLPTPAGLTFLRVGGMGVTLFFLISAYSLCLTMPRHIKTGRWLLSFYTHRVCRVLPLFYTVLLITTYFFISRGVDIAWGSVLINISCLFNFIPGEEQSVVMAGWTIGVEILFYAIFPILYKCFNTLPKSLILFAGSMIIGITAKHFITDQTFYQWNILRHAPIFTGGMVLFHTIQRVQSNSVLFRNLMGWTLCLGFLPAYIFFNTLVTIPGMGYYVQLIPFGILLAGFSLTPPRVLVSPATAFLGKISYSIYLLHPLLVKKLAPIYPWIYALNLGETASLALCAFLTLLILLPLAYMSFVYIEQPGIALGKRIVGSCCANKSVRGQERRCAECDPRKIKPRLTQESKVNIVIPNSGIQLKIDFRDICFYLILLLPTLFKLWLVMSCEITAWPWQSCDEGLYVSLGQNIVDGNWLGGFNQYTLVKGPFFPLFLAVIYYLSIPLLVAQELLYIVACLMIIVALRPILPGRFAILVIYLPLLFCPITFEIHRVLRDLPYMSMTMIIVACSMALILRFDSPLRKNWPWATVLGCGLAMAWHTREEGICLLPFLVLVVIIFFIARARGSSSNGLRMALLSTLAVSAIPFAILMSVTMTIAGINKHKYGVFSTTEISNSAFKTAFGTLCGIDMHEKHRYIPMSLASLEKAYEASPAARELKPYFDGPGKQWKPGGVELLPKEFANEYKGGYFMWAFRDAVAYAGYYRNWPDTERYYKRLTDELDTACRAGRLVGLGRTSSLAPILTFKSDFIPWFHMMERGAKILAANEILYGFPPDESEGADEGIRNFEILTNCRARQTRTTVAGWAFLEDGTPDLQMINLYGQPAQMDITRFPRPDVYEVYKDVLKPNGMYGFRINYHGDAKLRIADGTNATHALLDVKNGESFFSKSPVRAGVRIESVVSIQSNLLKAKYSIRSSICKFYRIAMPWLGLCAIPAVLLFLPPLFGGHKKAWLIFALSVCLLCLITCRLALLSLLAISSFNAFLTSYMASLFPMYMLMLLLLISAVVFHWKDTFSLLLMTAPDDMQEGERS
ncbi:MAG: acyltransferase [Kiritimatiellae bacterium]|nr:acyltransferase [Kiritimatiellia bacterium]MDD5521720.1 acyltransferase [Kiritimatiellia bacterium]